MSGSFSPFSKDISARVIKTDMISNYPIEISTYAVDSGSLGFNTVSSDLKVKRRHSYPSDFDMEDLSPASYAQLATNVKEDEATAVKYLE